MYLYICVYTYIKYMGCKKSHLRKSHFHITIVCILLNFHTF